MANKLVLKISGPGGTDQVITKQDADSLIIGSGPAAAIKLDDQKIAGLHFMIKVEGSSLSLIDLGGEGGTRVGGAVIKAPTSVKVGDVIEAGDSKISIAEADLGEGAAEEDGKKASTKDDSGKKGKKEKSRKEQQEKTAQVPVAAGASGNAARLFNEELPPEETPAPDNKQLEVAMLWGDTIINVRHFSDHQQVTIGALRRNHFSVYAAAIGDAFPLATCNGRDCVLSVPASGAVVLRRGDSEKSREQLASEGCLKPSDTGTQTQSLAMELHDRVQISVENVSFIIRWVRPHKLVTTGAGFDFYFTKVMTTTAMAGMVLLAAIFMTDINAESLSEDLFKNPQRFAKLVIKPPEKEKKKLELKVKEKQVKQEKVEEKYGQYKKDENTRPGPQINANKRESDRKKVMSAGLLGLLGGGDGATSNVFGQGGLGTGLNNALGTLKDSGVADTGGIGGLGSRGTGPGGGGTGLGLGGIGTKGGGRGGGGGYGSIDLGGRGKSHTRVVPGKTTVTGSCERTVIGKVISRHANEIRYCYEVELNKDPNLSGKVAVSFTIDPTGAISDASIAQTTVNNNNVEQCMLTRIRRWKFPEPKGGGVCIINYPWVLKAAGGGEGEEEE